MEEIQTTQNSLNLLNQLQWQLAILIITTQSTTPISQVSLILYNFYSLVNMGRVPSIKNEHSCCCCCFFPPPRSSRRLHKTLNVHSTLIFQRNFQQLSTWNGAIKVVWNRVPKWLLHNSIYGKAFYYVYYWYKKRPLRRKGGGGPITTLICMGLNLNGHEKVLRDIVLKPWRAQVPLFTTFS